MLASYGLGGVAWDYAQYAIALERLGFDVYYLEDTGWEAYDPHSGSYGADYTYGAAFVERSINRLAPRMARRWHVRGMDGTCYGMSREEIVTAVQEADLFLNVSGSALLRDEYLPSRHKVLIDTDPGWNHFRNWPQWEAKKDWHRSSPFNAHDHFFTYAQRLGQPDCPLPSFGLEWHPTRPPVITEAWAPEPPGRTWTTVMTWKNFQDPITYDGTTYGTKEREFGHIEGLPHAVDAPLEVAVGGTAPPVDRWRSLGWSVVGSESISRSVDDYRSYVQRSRGEFSVAKNVYVATHSGWFSCRSVCYLAAGRPVIVQDTGFSQLLPIGEGLLAFSTFDEAVAAISRVERDYETHAATAQALAAEYFRGETVLEEMLSRIGLRV